MTSWFEKDYYSELNLIWFSILLNCPRSWSLYLKDWFLFWLYYSSRLLTWFMRNFIILSCSSNFWSKSCKSALPCGPPNPPLALARPYGSWAPLENFSSLYWLIDLGRGGSCPASIGCCLMIVLLCGRIGPALEKSSYWSRNSLSPTLTSGILL